MSPASMSFTSAPSSASSRRSASISLATGGLGRTSNVVFRRLRSSSSGLTRGSSASASARVNCGISSLYVAKREGPMATFVLLTKVTPAGVKTLQANPRRIKEVNKEIEAQGARVVAQYATLGRYDFVNVVEAKDGETMG